MLVLILSTLLVVSAVPQIVVSYKGVPISANGASPTLATAVALGSQGVMQFVIANTGNTVLLLGSGATLPNNNFLQLTRAGPFTLLTAPGTLSIAPGQSTTFEMQFVPTVTGTKQEARFNVLSNSAVAPPELRMDGDAVGGPGTPLLQLRGQTNLLLLNADLVPDQLDVQFGAVTIGQSAAKTFTITNFGSANLLVTAVSIPSSANSASFAVVSTAATVRVEQTLRFTVTFAPVQEGQLQQVTLNIASSNAPAFNVALTGNGQVVTTLTDFLALSSFSVSGSVDLTFKGNSVDLAFSLSGVDPSCTTRANVDFSCGVTINNGVCNGDPALIQAVGVFDPATPGGDPWLSGSDYAGNPVGQGVNAVTNLLPSAQHVNKVLVVSDRSGAPIACSTVFGVNGNNNNNNNNGGNANNNGAGSSVGPIVGGIVGGIVLLIILGVVAFVITRRTPAARKAQPDVPESAPKAVPNPVVAPKPVVATKPPPTTNPTAAVPLDDDDDANVKYEMIRGSDGIWRQVTVTERPNHAIDVGDHD